MLYKTKTHTYPSFNYQTNGVRGQKPASVGGGIGYSVHGSRVLWTQSDVVHLIAGIHGAGKSTGNRQHELDRDSVAAEPGHAQKSEGRNHGR